MQTESPSVGKILQHVTDHFNEHITTIKNNVKGNPNLARSVAIFLAVQLSNKPFSKIASYFHNLGISGVSKAYHQFLKMRFIDTEMQEELKFVAEKIKKSTVEI